MVDELTRQALSLLLFLETRAVDYGGRVNGRHMNEQDFALAKKMASDGLIGFGRIVARDCNRDGAHWVTLTPEAWEAVHGERKARAARMWESRRFQLTSEK